MTRNLSLWLHIVACAGLAVLCAAVPGAAEQARLDCPVRAHVFKPDPAFTSEFLIERCRFKDEGSNPFFILKPGYQTVLESDEEMQIITVLDETKTIHGIVTRVVQEDSFEKDDDEVILVERSLNYFAICRPTNTVFYFGEDVLFFDEEGNVIGTEGAWLAFRNGARPGIIMPGTVLVGAKYYEEIAPEDEALDKARVLSVKKGCEAGGRKFRQLCAKMAGSNDCSDDRDQKVYAAGVGIIRDDDLEITSAGFIDD